MQSVAALKADVLDAVATARAEVQQANAAAAAKGAETLETLKESARDGFAKLRADADKGQRKAALKDAAESRKQFANQIAAAKRKHAAERTAGPSKKDRHIANLNRGKQAVDAKKSASQASAAQLEALRQKAWKKGMSLTEAIEKASRAASMRRTILRMKKAKLDDAANNGKGMRKRLAQRSQIRYDLYGADWWLQRQFELDANVKIVEHFMELFAGLTPGLGFLTAGYELLSGKDLAGNEITSGFTQFMNAIGFGLPVAAAVAPRLISSAQKLGRWGKRSKASKTAGRLDEAAALRGALKRYQKQSHQSRRAQTAMSNGTRNFFGHGDTVTPPVVPQTPKKSRWDYINEWHDKRATEIFGNGEGRVIPETNRTYDKVYKGKDIEFKSDNFKNGPRSQSELDRMSRQIDKDIQNMNEGLANPHWHFDHDPRQAEEMAPLLKKLEDGGIPWTWGKATPF